MSTERIGDGGETGNAGRGYETRDLSVRVSILFGVFLLLAAVVVHLVVWVLYVHFGTEAASTDIRQYPLAHVGRPVLPPEPRLQVQPREDLKALHRQEDAILSSYGWVDRNTGVVRIPADRAMQLTIERGLLSAQEPVPPDSGNTPPAASRSGRPLEAARQ
jgi:hypothetical protein